MSTLGNPPGRPARRTAIVAGVTAATLLAAGCASSPAPGGGGPTSASRAGTVAIQLTPQGCGPRPARIAAGEVTFNVANKGADAVSEAELRTADLTHILGEQENLTPGLSGAFTLDIQPGTYQINCPGATRPRWTLTVSGQAHGPAWPSSARLASAVDGYASYVNHNVARLVSRTRAFCRAISQGSLAQAKLRYPEARVYYEHIEPVAEIWGSLDTSIDGRWENPVTVKSQFTGFHRLEQLMWQDSTLSGAPQLCAGLVAHERQLRKLVSQAQYNPLELASGAIDLVSEAATAKISGEEERYSNTDFPVLAANADGAMKVVALLRPYLQQKAPGLVPLIEQRDAAVVKLLARYQASPGYDGTGYVTYAAVPGSQRRQLGAAVNALAEALSKMPVQVG